ncbi:hypothetical protein TraAM80_01304 [Trypanosoma rangeli]|uniref:Uncharacterized protein n=1 Tax=Trypanosoma rangeli TaxID=5698 RepID=A0A422NZ20_TRYRA|nr:uncharacterized protein TraAM80_01304 [Trypanosoma rangeli]RNF10743.1 hypothetical protein TraAM80_01304 [Trypanosoma rangeli]|eukprot:RNF10743.1 hypothetical protein TraAM80_01304 [Trypanosoma rangeli]
MCMREAKMYRYIDKCISVEAWMGGYAQRWFPRGHAIATAAPPHHTHLMQLRKAAGMHDETRPAAVAPTPSTRQVLYVPQQQGKDTVLGALAATRRTNLAAAPVSFTPH